MKTTALLYFHQGWEDILFCLPLINYHASRYTFLYVLARQDAWNLLQFYIRGLKNVSIIYAPLSELNVHGVKLVKLPGATQILHGQFDGGRMQQFSADNPKLRIDQLFYEAYGLSTRQRIDSFSFYRDPATEEVAYIQHVHTNEPYICIHDEPLYNKFVCEGGVSVVDLSSITSNMFFDAIRILQHAKEIHLVDSSWAIACFMMDSKYGLFHQIPIHVYCYDESEGKFEGCPPNWVLHSANDSRAKRDKTGAAFVSFANGGYAAQQTVLVSSIRRYSPEIPVFPFTTFESMGSPPHSENPYAFKVYAIQKARSLGYTKIIWCDSVLRLTQPIQNLFPEITKHGAYFQEDGWNVAQWTNDRALTYFGVDRNTAESISAIYACFMAYDFNVPITEEFFRRWKKACEDGIFRGKWKNENNCESKDIRCKGHRHDQSCAELISYQLGIPRSPMRVLPGTPRSDRYFTTWNHL